MGNETGPNKPAHTRRWSKPPGGPWMRLADEKCLGLTHLDELNGPSARTTAASGEPSQE
jgi:hypothetical protein